MNLHEEVGIWNNPLVDIASEYYRNGFCTEHSGKFSVILTEEELMIVVAYMMFGMNKVKKINKPLDKQHPWW
jgi:ribulose-5-phosphate 4-epimerase/fuculose-1-phosphate aldolase